MSVRKTSCCRLRKEEIEAPLFVAYGRFCTAPDSGEQGRNRKVGMEAGYFEE